VGYTKRQLINAALEELGLDAFDQDSFDNDGFTKQQIIDLALDKLGMQSFSDSDTTNSYTKREIINASLEEIGLSPDELDITSAENQRVGRNLEALVKQWLLNGVEINYNFASDIHNPDLSEATELSHYALQALSLNLAIRIAPSFGKQILPDTKENAVVAYNILANRSVSLEFQVKCLNQLDALMAKWLRFGVDFGYNVPTSSDASFLTEESGLYNWGREATYLALAVKIAPLFNREASNALIIETDNAFESAKKKSISANYVQKCARRLEALIARLDGENIPLSYLLAAEPENIDIDVESGIPDWSYECVYLNLAVQIAPVFQLQLTIDTKKNAKIAKNTARIKTFTLSERQYRDVLPVGAGNKPWQGRYDRFFNETDYLSEVSE